MANADETKVSRWGTVLTLDNLRKWYDLLPVEFLNMIPHHCNYDVTQDRRAVNIGERRLALEEMTLNDHIALLGLTTWCQLEMHQRDMELLDPDVQHLLFVSDPVMDPMPIPDYHNMYHNFNVG